MKVSAIMKRSPRTVEAGDSVARARDIMVWGGFRHLPVVEPESGRLVGVLSEFDVAGHQARAIDGNGGPTTDTVSTVMSETVHTAGPDDSVTEVTARMASEKIGCLPVTEYGKLVGLVTVTDALAAEVHAALGTNAAIDTKVAEVMTKDPRTSDPDDYLLDAAARMSQYEIRHLPVVDVEGHVLGMLSDRDIRACIGEPSRAFGPDADRSKKALSVSAEALRVSHAMSVPPVTTTGDESCAVAAHSFVGLKAGAVPVVDVENKLVGIVSYVDLLRAFAK